MSPLPTAESEFLGVRYSPQAPVEVRRRSTEDSTWERWVEGRGHGARIAGGRTKDRPEGV